MPAAFQSAATGSADSASSVTVSKPSGTVDGDLLVAVHLQDPDGVPTNQTAPAGWTQDGTTQDTSNGSTKTFWKNAAGEGASWSFGADAIASSIVIVLRINGHNPAAPFDVSVSYGTGAASLSHVAPDISPARTDSLLICGAVGNATSAAASYTPPGTMTERADVQPPALWMVATAATEGLSASGATGTRTFTCTLSRAWNAYSFAINSASKEPVRNADAVPRSFNW